MVKEYLTELKALNGASWEDIAQKSGVPVSTIRKIVSGETVNPQYETVCKIASALGGTVDDMPGKRSADIDKLERAYEARISDARFYTKLFAIMAFAFAAVLIAFLIADLFITSAGWIIR